MDSLLSSSLESGLPAPSWYIISRLVKFTLVSTDSGGGRGERGEERRVEGGEVRRGRGEGREVRGGERRRGERGGGEERKRIRVERMGRRREVEEEEEERRKEERWMERKPMRNRGVITNVTNSLSHSQT